MSTYNVTAVQWSGGWELHIDGVGVTQCRTLDHAEEMVRDYLRLDDHADWAGAEVAVVPDLDGLEKEIAEARAEIATASELQRRAAEHSRSVARALRERGLSVTDTAVVLGVSRGRVSQLVRN